MLTLSADSYGFDSGGSVVNHGTIDWSASTGIVTALYDMNGSYTPGIVRTNPCWRAAPLSGLVTQFTAYQLINSIADLSAVNNNLAGNYALGNQLGNQLLEFASAPDFSGIGTAANPFTGQFDGMRYLPVDLHLSGAANTGLFGAIGKSGVVRNVTLADGTATSSGGAAGLLAGINWGYMVNVGATGTVNSTGSMSTVAGGLVGENFGRIEQAWFAGNINGTGEIGGLVGLNHGRIDLYLALGSITAGSQSTVGGLVGTNNGAITRSYANDFLNGGATIGGLVGSNTGFIRESYAWSKLTVGANSTTGGIAGTNSGRIAANVFWNRESSGASAGVGGRRLGRGGSQFERTNGRTVKRPGKLRPDVGFQCKRHVGRWGFFWAGAALGALMGAPLAANG